MASEAVQRQFVEALEDNGVSVDSTRSLVGNLSLMYGYDADRETEDVATIAVVFAQAPSLVNHVLSVTAIRTGSGADERVATFTIERKLAEQFVAGDLSKAEYVSAVRETWGAQ